MAAVVDFDPLTVTVFLTKVKNVCFGLSNIVIHEDVFIEAGYCGLCHFLVNGNFEGMVPNGVLATLVRSVGAILYSIVDYLDVGIHVAKYFGIAKEFSLRHLQAQCATQTFSSFFLSLLLRWLLVQLL